MYTGIEMLPTTALVHSEPNSEISRSVQILVTTSSREAKRDLERIID